MQKQSNAITLGGAATRRKGGKKAEKQGPKRASLSEHQHQMRDRQFKESIKKGMMPVKSERGGRQKTCDKKEQERYKGGRKCDNNGGTTRGEKDTKPSTGKEE